MISIIYLFFKVEPGAFNRLTNLIELDLSENTMREIPSESWKHTKALMRLNLSGNPIKLIRSGAFQRLKFVTNIALSHCDIETVEKGIFQNDIQIFQLPIIFIAKTVFYIDINIEIFINRCF